VGLREAEDGLVGCLRKDYNKSKAEMRNVTAEVEDTDLFFY